MNQRKYFLYYHTYAKEFKIVESILAGNSVIYATPLNNEDLAKSVDQAINGNLTDFAYTRGYMHAELKIDK